MKTKLLLCSVFFAVAAVATAQPAPPAPPEKKTVPRQATHIESDRVEFDMATSRAVYLGHVKVDDPQLKLQCEQLTVDLPKTGGQPTNIVAEVNVIMDFADSQGQTAHATGDRAVYHYAVTGGVTNATVTLTGSPPKVDNVQGSLTGTEIIFDVVTRRMTATDPKMISKQNLDGNNADTNAPGLKLF
jgi:lipopolysaccharide transport protein LptA